MMENNDRNTVVDIQAFTLFGLAVDKKDILQTLDMARKYDIAVGKIKGGDVFASSDMERWAELRKTKAMVLDKKLLWLNRRYRETTNQSFIRQRIDLKDAEQVLLLADDFCDALYRIDAAV